jgi:hypothetical protein
MEAFVRRDVTIVYNSHTEVMALKGQLREIFFWPIRRHVFKGDLSSEFFWLGRKVAEILCLSSYSQYTAKCLWRFLLIRLRALSAFSVHTKILLAYSETTSYK